MEMKVIRPGMLTTVQDLGRRGMRRAGLAEGGAMDKFALQLANLLVGNEGREAGLEITLTGPELEFSEEVLVAIAGATMDGVDQGKPIRIKAGERLKLSGMKKGCRAYLAVAGGFKVREILGGRGTDLRAGVGGVNGRALKAGDVLEVNQVKREVRGRWSVSPRLLPAYGEGPVVRTLPGVEADEFSGTLWRREFKLSSDSDRMGYRLLGPKMRRNTDRELISTAMIPGTVQVPASGEPIVLMADAQTLGGYPRLAQVIQVDLPLLAQLRPGDKVRFSQVSLEEAHALVRHRERDLSLLKLALREKVR